MSDTSPVLFERRDGIARVTLNRPQKMNALTPEMVVRLAAFWEEVADDDAVRAVLVTGAGEKAFCSGGDLGTLIPIMMRTRDPADEWEERLAARRSLLYAALLRNDTFFKPVVAAINGARTGRRRRVRAQHRHPRGLDDGPVRTHRGAPRSDRGRRLAGPVGPAGRLGRRDGGGARR